VNSDLKKYIINENASIKDALKKVDDNTYGMIFIASSSDEIIGLATDGDIRRSLLKGATLDDKVSLSANRDFVRENTHTTRENLIKKLDGHIQFIPILDEDGKLHTIISKDFLHLRDEEDFYIRSRSPVRISFGGGGSDVTHYFSEGSGAVINATVSIYSHATMKVADDLSVAIHSQDLGGSLKAKNLEEALSRPGAFGLILAVLRVINPKFGFEIYLHSDFPVGSGLGGSAALTAAMLGCFNMLRHDRWDRHELAEIAFQAERLHFGIAGGWQDQYATVFGGFNFLEFGSKENIVNPIRVHADTVRELEESLILCDTGIIHHSGDIHKDQKNTMSSELIKKMVKENVALTYNIRDFLLRGQLENFGKALHETWQLKRNFSEMISNESIDKIYNGALKHGALGGKLLGAGGGGFFIFYVPPFKKHDLLNYLKRKGLLVQPFRFEPDGLQSWTSRISKTNKFFKEI